MRAELDASLCIPEERPVNLKLDPVKVDARLSGTPGVAVSPVAVDLPAITVTLPGLTVELPSPTVTATVGLAGDNVVEYLTGMRTFMQSLNPLGSLGPPLVLPDPTDVFIFAAAVAALGPGVLKALALPTLEAEVKVTLGKLKISSDQPLVIDTGQIKLHGVPTAGDDQPITVGADLGDTGVAAALDAVKVALSGCVVLNGGDPPAPPPPPPPPPPTVLGIDVKTDDAKKGLHVEIRGQGFGAPQGQGFVVLNQMGLALSPDRYEAWTDVRIAVTFRPVPAPGAYAITVTTAQGLSTQPMPLALP